VKADFSSIKNSISKPFKVARYGALYAITRDPDYLLMFYFSRAPLYQYIAPAKEDSKKVREFLRRRKSKSRRENLDRLKFLGNMKNKTVLDLGSNLGFFGFAFGSNLKRYVGVDTDADCIRACNLLKRHRGLDNFEFKKMNIEQFVRVNEERFDVCLLFSVYHHLLLNLGTRKARKILNSISKFSDVLYFDMGQIDEKAEYPNRSWYSVLPNVSPEQYIIDEITSNSDYSKGEVLGVTKVGKSRRLFFRFTK
jgi:hypothetical protein